MGKTARLHLQQTWIDCSHQSMSKPMLKVTLIHYLSLVNWYISMTLWREICNQHVKPWTCSHPWSYSVAGDWVAPTIVAPAVLGTVDWVASKKTKFLPSFIQNTSLGKKSRTWRSRCSSHSLGFSNCTFSCLVSLACFSSYSQPLKIGRPQGSVPGPLLTHWVGPSSLISSI